jgi:hypothetical protein
MSTIRRLSAFALAVAAALPGVARAQAVGPTPPVTPQLDFSGVIYGNYKFQTDSASKAPLGQKAPNKFDIERVYLNFRMPAGDHGSIRVTTDVFNNANGNYYNGWTARLKYAYFQYAFNPSFLARVGMLHTVVIDHEEGFWPRWISQTAVERAGFFSSSDVGVAGLGTLGNKMGEVYATITNGSGYSQSETDRFKDFAARLSLTPLARGTSILKTLTITPWFYKGATGSAAPASFTDPLKKDRYGIFGGVKDRRLSAGLEWAQRTEDVETLTAGPPPTQVVADRKGRLLDGFAVVRPGEWADATKKSPLGLVARYDIFKLNTASTTAPDAEYKLLILGAFWDLNQKASFSIDYQGQTFSGFVPVASAPPQAKSIFAHWTVSF